jgi:hypothetical protein
MSLSVNREGRQQPFRKTIVIGIGLLLCAVVGIGFKYFRATEQDQEAYFSLMVEANQSGVDRAPKTAYTAAQKRQGVRKELTFLSNDRYMQLELLCADSTLRYHRHAEGHSELVEDMSKVLCLMQEELYYLNAEGKKSASACERSVPMQIIRVCVAAEAVYSYQTELCTAEQVEIKRYVCAGHSLRNVKLDSLTPVMKGTAAHIEFSLSGGHLNFKATRLQGLWKREVSS